MRLLQVNLRGSLVFSLVLILVSIPLSLISIQTILNQEVDESITHQAEQFLEHIKGFEYLDDLDTDLQVIDKLSSNIHIKPAGDRSHQSSYRTIMLLDSIDHEEKPYRQLQSTVSIKGKPYDLIVQMSLVDNNDLVLAIGLVQIAVSILLAAALLIWNRSLSKRLWKPFYNTLDQLKAYELDKSESIPIEQSQITEFNDLNKTVRHLAEKNRKIFLQQKEFIENASHELQTPIAIFQSKLDALMQNPNLTHADAETLLELESTAQRMARLNKNLLLLSKIDNEQFISKEEIELSDLITGQLKILNAMSETSGIPIVTHLSPLTIHASKTLIEVLLTNLFHNAIRHSPKGEVISIRVNGRTLMITNRGSNSPIDMEKMTQRFSKESADPGSTGLGLAIVKRICDSCQYRLSYTFKNAEHTFSVDF